MSLACDSCRAGQVKPPKPGQSRHPVDKDVPSQALLRSLRGRSTCMKKTILAILTAAALAGLAGCESNAGPNLSYRLTREGVVIHAAGVSTVVALPGWLWVDAPYCPPNLAVGPKGEVVITSNVVPTLWRVDPQTLSVTVHPLSLDIDSDKDVGFAAIVYSTEQTAFAAYSEVQRSIWKIDPQL